MTHVLQQQKDVPVTSKPSYNKRYKDNPKREAYIEERDSYYVAAGEYYRKQKEYYRNRTKQYASATQNNKTDNRQYYSASKHNPAKFSTLTLIDPNKADSITLCSIPGIGRTISANILQYRQRLGGFVRKEQLLECRYFTEELLTWFKIEENPQVKPLPINVASYAQLISHPYIGKKETQNILNYRKTYGTFADSEALRVSGIFSEETFTKLLPYIEY